LPGQAGDGTRPYVVFQPIAVRRLLETAEARRAKKTLCCIAQT